MYVLAQAILAWGMEPAVLTLSGISVAGSTDGSKVSLTISSWLRLGSEVALDRAAPGPASAPQGRSPSSSSSRRVHLRGRVSLSAPRRCPRCNLFCHHAVEKSLQTIWENFRLLKRQVSSWMMARRLIRKMKFFVKISTSSLVVLSFNPWQIRRCSRWMRCFQNGHFNSRTNFCWLSFAVMLNHGCPITGPSRDQNFRHGECIVQQKELKQFGGFVNVFNGLSIQEGRARFGCILLFHVLVVHCFY